MEEPLNLRYSRMEALALTLGLSIILILYTVQSNQDFSSWIPIANQGLHGVLLALCVQVFLQVPGLHQLASLAGVAVFCVYIIVDTQRLMSNPEKYILVDCMLLIDILNLLLHIMCILEARE